MDEELEVTEENVKYAISTAKEIDNLNLLSGEKVDTQLRAIVYNKLSQSPGFVVLTDKRLVFLTHHALSPDKALYIPLNKIQKVSLKTNTKIELKYQDNTITFSIDITQKIMTGISGAIPINFIDKLKSKLPDNVVQ